MQNTKALFVASHVVTGYGRQQVLNDVSLTVSAGEIVTIIGHNASGKSTFLKAVLGMLPLWQGEVHIDGARVTPVTVDQLIQRGVAYIPQGNRVYNDLTVKENLLLAGTRLPHRRLVAERISALYMLFPLLEQRQKQKAGTLSGGEKQVLALARGLFLSPRLLLLDEPLASLDSHKINDAIALIQRVHQSQGVSLVIVEHRVRPILEIAHRVYCMRRGSVSFSGTPTMFTDATLREVYL